MYSELSIKQLEHIRMCFNAHAWNTERIHDVEDMYRCLKVNPDEVGMFTLEDMAEITGLSVFTLRQYVREEKIIANKKWRHHMVTANEIARFLYKQDTGREIPHDLAVGVALSVQDIADPYNTILEYRFFNILDFNWNIETGFPNGESYFNTELVIQRLEQQVLPNIGCIELIRFVPDFFRLTGLLSAQTDETMLLQDGFKIKPEKRKILYENAYKIVNKKAALQDIKEVFGDVKNLNTLLKMYQELQQTICYYQELQTDYENLISKYNQLERQSEQIRSQQREN